MEAGVGRLIEYIDGQPFLRYGIRVLHIDSYRQRHDDSRALAPWNCAVIGLTAPEMGAVQVGAEAVIARQQVEVHPAELVRRSVKAQVDVAIEDVDRQPLLRHLKFVFIGARV